MLDARPRSLTPRTVGDIALRLVEGHEAVGPPPFPTGYDPLDHVLDGGLRHRDLILVGGLPGVGKTVATLQWARHIAASGRRALYACYEHDERALLGRLILQECGDGGHSFERAKDLRTLLRAMLNAEIPHTEAFKKAPILQHAFEQVGGYADRLLLVRASGSETGLLELEEMVVEHGEDDIVLFVDYLQKVAVPGLTVDDTEKGTRVVEGLKEMALRRGAPVVALVAAERVALDVRRIRLHHLRGSSALAYEADVALLLNDKFEAVSKVHSAHDPVRAETFKRQVVFSIEKNRDGPVAIDLEFDKDFEHYRFDPHGDYVQERLVDERLYRE